MNRIREYKEDDLQDLYELYLDCFYDNPVPFWQFKESVEKGRTYVLDYSGLKAFVISFIEDDEPWIWAIGTNQFMRGLGIGNKLLERVEEYYESLNYKRINLFVGQSNPAQKLYFDRGYRIKRVVKDIYKTEDALKMIKDL